METDSVLPVDSDAVLTLPLGPERLEPVSRRRPQVVKHFDDVKLIEFPLRDRPQMSRTTSPRLFRINVVVDVFSAPIRK
jgi:hypothetical protein